MKKLLTFMLSGILIIGLIACKSDSPPEPDNSQSYTTTEVTTKPEMTSAPKTVTAIETTTEPLETTTTATPANPETPDYVAEAKRLMTPENGDIYIGMVDLKKPNGYRYVDDCGGIHPASTIKAQIMEYALWQVIYGNAALNDNVGGYTLKHRIEQMIQVSCNESTAYIIAKFGRENIDNWLLENYPNTRLHSDWVSFNPDGIFNTTTVEDNIVFLENMFHNREYEPYKTMLDIMFNTTWSRDKIPAATVNIPNVTVANKTGSFVDGAATADHDIAIIIEWGTNGEIITAYALAFYSFSNYTESTYSAARPAIIAMAQDIYENISNYEKTR
ncbi:MAG: serine hydrolase [Oscillospiraceae bacterium]|nr:serine hydrolase [Oscillospiraceae bacterium]